MATQTDMFAQFDGKTVDKRFDGKRLKTNLDRVFALMRDGEKRTLATIAQTVGCSESGASARLRDLRKAKFQSYYGACEVHSERVAKSGLWVYWVEVK